MFNNFINFIIDNKVVFWNRLINWLMMEGIVIFKVWGKIINFKFNGVFKFNVFVVLVWFLGIDCKLFLIFFVK